MRQRYPFSLYAYALMSDHFHLLLEVHRFPTARILQSLLTGYARRFFSDPSNIAGLGELSIAFLFDENPGFASARSGGAPLGDRGLCHGGSNRY